MASKNSSGADNQQERLDWWITGFVDGEGTFSVSINRNQTTARGFQVFPEFVITQGEKSMKSLEKIRERFGCGNVYVNRRKDNHNENLYRYVVRSLNDLKNRIIPFFESYQLKTAKQEDFRLFCKVVSMMGRKRHLEDEGFSEILKIVSKMNRKQSRILNDYTPEPPKRRQDIV